MADNAHIRLLARQLGRIISTPIRVYLTGGATAVVEGWRDSTSKIALLLEPRDDQLLRELPEIEKRIGVSIELSSPLDLIPELPGWRPRSPLLSMDNGVELRHFDLYSQALVNIEREAGHDLEDVRMMIELALVLPDQLRDFFERIERDLYRYPKIDRAVFKQKLNDALVRASRKPHSESLSLDY